MNARVNKLLAMAAVCAAGASSASAQVKISQVYGGGGNAGAQYNRDYVELFNSSGAPVNITGWSIQYAASAGTTWTNRPLPAVSIPAGGYYLISMATANGANGVALPTPDFQVATAVAMSATDAKLALMRNATTIVSGTSCPTADPNIEDFIGFGTANCFEGASAAPQLSNTTAAFRVLDGCFDNNQNGGNFIAAVPAPRNGATPPTTCSGSHTDLGVSISGGSCPVSVGSPVVYTATVNNFGPLSSDATFTATIPSNLTLVSSVPAGSVAGNLLTVTLGSMASGASSVVTLNFTGATAGTGAPTVAVASSTNDPGPANNTATGTYAFVVPTSAVAKAVFSNVATNSNSDVPAGVSAASKFFFSATTGSEVFGRLFPSADGTRIVFRGLNNLATTTDQMIVSFPTANPAAAATHAQEGATDLGGGELLGLIDTFPSINNGGDIAYSADTNAATNDEVVVKVVGGVHTVVAREGGTNGAGGPIGINATASGITTAGDVLYWHQGPTLNTSDQYVMLGSTAVAQEGINVPLNQVAGGTATWFQFDNATDLGKYSDVSGDGLNTLLSGDVGASTVDTLALNGSVVLMDGSTIPGVSGVVTDIRFSDIYSGANWFAYGSNTAEDWVLLNGAVLTKVDAPITQGNTELWDDAPFAQTFFIAAANPNGTYVVGGTTNSADINNNAVLVLNGRTILARENDPVDLNGDGIFNDDAYIRTFRDDRAVLLNDAFYFVAELRMAAGYCAGNAKVADAVIRIPVACPADLDNDGDFGNGGNPDLAVDISDLIFFLQGFEAGNMDLDNDGDPAICIPDGGTDVNDLLFFLSRFQNGC
jgi:Lamin Tail Domain/Domain of unknown function DUF11